MQQAQPHLTIGLLGLGTVGSGVLELLSAHRTKISAITGMDINVSHALVSDVTKKRDIDLTGITLTENASDITANPNIDLVVEVMGGTTLSYSYIKAALMNGKHVVSANKDLMATHGPTLVKLASDNGCDLFYEASVAGGIPILRTLAASFAADQITQVAGIINGTTNFILTKMATNHTSYAQALKAAQRQGFAEADPTNDVEGIDAAYKMIILSQFAFGTRLTLADVAKCGITHLTTDDITAANDLGYTIKLIGSAQLVKNNELAVSVSPTLVHNDNPLASVTNENNAIAVTSTAVGQSMFYGPGAGKLPTANSVVADIMAVARNKQANTCGRRFSDYDAPLSLAQSDHVTHPYFLSLTVKDEPGQLQKLSTIMAQNAASIKLFTQTQHEYKHTRIVLVTHSLSLMQLQNIKNAITTSADLFLNAAYPVLD